MTRIKTLALRSRSTSSSYTLSSGRTLSRIPISSWKSLPCSTPLPMMRKMPKSTTIFLILIYRLQECCTWFHPPKAYLGLALPSDLVQDSFWHDQVLQDYPAPLPVENPEVVQLFGSKTDKLELEQMARHIGMQLPIDRFQINNMLVILSVQLFILKSMFPFPAVIVFFY